LCHRFSDLSTAGQWQGDCTNVFSANPAQSADSGRKAVRRVEAGQCQASVDKTLDMSARTLLNRVNANRQGRLTEAGVTRAMRAEQMEIAPGCERNRRGNGWDDACGETRFGSLKVERPRRQCFITRRQTKDETLDWPGTINPGCIPP
jgi:hypothetical protein